MYPTIYLNSLSMPKYSIHYKIKQDITVTIAK